MYTNYVKSDGPSDNYAARDKKKQKSAQNNVNILNNQSGNKYQVPTQKVKITIYKNGFSINNGSFRDIKIQENNLFVKQILKGIIPQELKNKGITGNITLDKRMNEEFITYSPNMPSYTTGEYTINKTNINQNIYTNNIYQDNTYQNYTAPNNAYQNYNNYNIKGQNQNNNINIDYTSLTNQNQYSNNAYNNYYPSQGNQNNIYVNDLNNYMNNLNVNEYPTQPQPHKNPNPANITNNIQNTKNINNIATPVVNNYGTGNNNLVPKKEQVNNDNNTEKKNNTEVKADNKQKKPKKNFRTFGSWIKEEKEKEEDKELRKMQRHNIPPKNPIKEDPNENSGKKEDAKKEEKPKKKKKSMRTFGSWIREEQEKEEEKHMKKMQKFNLVPKEPIKEEPAEKEEGKNEKKFVPFGGEGYMIENVNVAGLHVNKDLKHTINEFIPKCQFNIRLFNGEIIKSEFNYTQTLNDVYSYVQKASGANIFVLLEGFPPKPLNQLNKTIQELHLDNTTLTQKVTENTNI